MSASLVVLLASAAPALTRGISLRPRLGLFPIVLGMLCLLWVGLMRYALPGFTNNWLVLIKATALVSLIGLQEMTYLAKQASAATRSPFAFFLFTAALFLLYTWASLVVLRRLHARYSLGTKRGTL